MPPKRNWARIAQINNNRNPQPRQNQQNPPPPQNPQQPAHYNVPVNAAQIAAMQRRVYEPLGNWRLGNGRPASAVSWMFSIRLSPDPNDPHHFALDEEFDDDGNVARNYRPAPLHVLRQPLNQRGVNAGAAVPVYLVYQLEQGNNGNPLFGNGFHYQGYIEFDNRVTAPQIIDIMQWQDFWWDVWLEPRRAKREDAVAYVQKVETRVMYDFEDGLGPQPIIAVEEGVPRNDDVVGQAAMIRVMVQDGANFDAISEAYPEAAMRCCNGIKAMITERVKAMPKVWRAVQVFVYWGDTRTGKSKRITDIEGQEKVYRKLAKSAYYDLYDFDVHEVLILEDFRGHHMTIDELLNICDGVPLLLNQKYGCSTARWNKVYITSNIAPSAWYPTADKREKDALFYRLQTGGVFNFINRNNKESVAEYEANKQYKMGDPRDYQNVLFMNTPLEPQATQLYQEFVEE